MQLAPFNPDIEAAAIEALSYDGIPNYTPTAYPEPEAIKASDDQVGGNHYKTMAIQPAEYCQRNKLNWCESNIIKYASRHASKNGAEDVRKIIHYAKLLLEWDYNKNG
jgi:hypothetical protein